jgi:NAD(P)-dependent dehydrogenase (short-subunit alcohol dehydrogenase family)
MSRTVLITGANRGIGLELAHQYLNTGWTVYACCRSPHDAEKLSSLVGEDLEIFALDVTDPASIDLLAEVLVERALDLLINNAGAYGPRGAGQTFGTLDYDAWLDVLETNTLGPLRVTEALLGNLTREGPGVVATITSAMGSIAQNQGGHYIYRSSKAAVNAAMKGLAQDLSGRDVPVVMIHPGWVRTEMGGPQAPVSVEESAAGIRQVIASLELANTGRFVDYTGAEIPW